MIIKAVRATIKLGDINLDVLQFPDGSYHLFINQLNEVLGIKASDSTGKKYLKPLIDKDPKRVNQASVEGIKSHLKTLSIDLVSEAIQAYAALGNQKCIAVAIACLAEALERRADSAFNVVRSEEERNTRIKARVQSKLTRRTLTDSIKEYIERHPELTENYSKFIYSNCSDHTNLTVLGAKSKQVKLELDLKPTGLLRDTIPMNSLREIEAIEMVAGRLIDAEDIEPLEATKKASQIMHAKTLGFQ